MPWEIKQNYGGCSGYAVVKLPDNQIQGCHSSRDAANAQMRALYASEGEVEKYHLMEDCSDPKNCPEHMASYHEEMGKQLITIKTQYTFQEGMFVMGPGNEYTKEHSHGKIEHVMREGSLGTGSKYEIQATQDEPALLIRIYKQVEDGWEETDLMTGFKASEATLVGTEQDMQEHSMEKAESVRVGQMVSWNSSGGRAQGRVTRIVRNGKVKVPDSSFEITGTPENPAVVIRLYRDGEPTDRTVGHRMSTLRVMSKDQSATVTNENTPNKYPDEVSASANYNDMNKRSLEDLDLRPTESMASNARRGLELRRKFGRGGTGVGVARARDLSNRTNLSPDTVLRMYSFFSRHEVDKKGKDFNNAERPSNGKIAWLLWGGDSGYSWSRSKRNAIMNIRAQKSSDPVWYDSAFSLRKYVDKNDNQ